MAQLKDTKVNGTLTANGVNLNDGNCKLSFSTHKFIIADSENMGDVRINIPTSVSVDLSIETWTFTTSNNKTLTTTLLANTKEG